VQHQLHLNLKIRRPDTKATNKILSDECTHRSDKRRNGKDEFHDSNVLLVVSTMKECFRGKGFLPPIDFSFWQPMKQKCISTWKSLRLKSKSLFLCSTFPQHSLGANSYDILFVNRTNTRRAVAVEQTSSARVTVLPT